MIVFLKGRKLWRYVTVSIPKLVPIPQSKATIDANSSKTRAAWMWLHVSPKWLLFFFNFFFYWKPKTHCGRGRREQKKWI